MSYNTALTGLTAQGIDAFTGLCYSNNDVSFTMTSSEFAQPNFKYIVLITDNTTTEQYKFYIAQNSIGSGIFNAKTIFNQLVKTPIVIDGTDNVVLQIDQPTLSDKNNVNTFNISLYEGYDVGGVFTEDNSVAVDYFLMCIYGSGKQNFIAMGTNDTRPLALSQLYDDEVGFNKETLAHRLILPNALMNEVINWKYLSRTNVTEETDSAYNVHTWIADDNSYINSNYPYNSIDHFTFDLYDENQTILNSFDIPMTFAQGSLLFLPTGLKNLVSGGYVDDATADSTSFYVYAGYNASDEQVTTKYGYYLVDDCKYNPVHVYWLNQMGGWDSYSFIKKNERSVEVERKRFKQYQGDFNTASFDSPYETKNYTRELTEREPIVNTFINLTSDWLCESEYKYMKDLFMSKSVWMVDDNVDGYSIVPVVVSDNNYLMKRERNSKKYNQNLRLQIASNNETINITAAEYPIPQPVACTYFDTFSKQAGSISSSIGANVGNACNVVFTMAGKSNTIVVYVEDGSGNTPIAGQTYYVKVEYSSNLPYANGKPGRIELGNVTTGGGTLTEFQMNDYTTPIIASGVWGTFPDVINTFKIQLPTWVGSISSKWSGNFYVTVGFGNCP